MATIKPTFCGSLPTLIDKFFNGVFCCRFMNKGVIVYRTRYGCYYTTTDYSSVTLFFHRFKNDRYDKIPEKYIFSCQVEESSTKYTVTSTICGVEKEESFIDDSSKLFHRINIST